MYLLPIFVGLLLSFIAHGQKNFAITDKVGQGNFAFVRPFAFAMAENGEWYPLTKRSAVPRFVIKKELKDKEKGLFAFAERPEDAKFAYTLANKAQFAFLK